jgi:hypothetical protein
MIPLSPALFMAGARTLIATDIERLPLPTSKQERLAELDPVERDTHGAQDSVTTAAFIGHVGYWVHRDPTGPSSWPFPRDADCNALARIGTDRGVVSRAKPEPGAVYLRWSVPEKRFVSAGIVLWVMDRAPQRQSGRTHDLHLLEGCAVLSCPCANIGPSTSLAVHPAKRPVRELPAVETTVHWARQVRVRSSTDLGDRYLSWVDLDRRNATTSVKFNRRAA